jgi:hypothetical protein
MGAKSIELGARGENKTLMRVAWFGGWGNGRWCLSRGPFELAAGEEVEMEVVDGLAAVAAGIDDDAVSVGEFQFAGQIADHQVDVADEVGIVVGQIGQRRDLFFGDHQHVGWGLWRDVVERQAAIVFVEDVGRDLFVDDLLEYRRHGGASSSLKLGERDRFVVEHHGNLVDDRIDDVAGRSDEPAVDGAFDVCAGKTAKSTRRDGRVEPSY